MLQSISLNSPICYEVKIQGGLDDAWLGWFGEASVRTEVPADDSAVTTLSSVVMDQAALVGLIRRLHGHGIVLLSVVACAPGDPAVSHVVPGAERNKRKPE